MSIPGGYLALLVLTAGAMYSKGRNTRKARLNEPTYTPLPDDEPLTTPSGPVYPPPPGPVGDTCASWQPVIIPPHGTVGVWQSDGQGGCNLVCNPGWELTPDGKGCVQVSTPQPTPQPQPTPTPPPPQTSQPADGPTAVGTCVNGYYSRTASQASPQLAFELDTPTTTLAQNKWFYLQDQVQADLFNAIRLRLMGPNRTLPSVAVRDALQAARSNCEFYGPLSGAELLTYESAMELAQLAMAQIGWRPGTSPGAHLLMKTPGTTTGPALVARDWLGITPTSAQAIQPQQRVELLAGYYDGPSNGPDAGFPYAESLIARVNNVDTGSQTFEVEVINQFQGKDRTPKLSSKHHYNVGTKIKLSMNAPTGLRRIYQQGVL